MWVRSVEMPPAGEAWPGEEGNVSVQAVSPVAAIDLQGVGISFRSARLKQEIAALRDIDLTVPDRLFVSLLRSEEHTSELQSREKLVCRLLLETKNTRTTDARS